MTTFCTYDGAKCCSKCFTRVEFRSGDGVVKAFLKELHERIWRQELAFCFGNGKNPVSDWQ